MLVVNDRLINDDKRSKLEEQVNFLKSLRGIKGVESHVEEVGEKEGEERDQ